jgi:hypothetical protein
MDNVGEHILLGGRWVRGRQARREILALRPSHFVPGRVAAGEQMSGTQRLLSRLGYGTGVRQDNWSEGLNRSRWPSEKAQVEKVARDASVVRP